MVWHIICLFLKPRNAQDEFAATYDVLTLFSSKNTLLIKHNRIWNKWNCGTHWAEPELSCAGQSCQERGGGERRRGQEGLLSLCRKLRLLEDCFGNRKRH